LLTAPDKVKVTLLAAQRTWRHAAAAVCLLTTTPLPAAGHGARPARHSKGTALHMAAVNFCCPDTMQQLLKHGADINAQLC
jgi:hypothetical protein